MRANLKFDRNLSVGSLPPSNSIEIEKLLLELAAKQAASDAQTRTLMLPPERPVSFCDFVALTVSEDPAVSLERFNLSKKGLLGAGATPKLIGRFSPEVRQLIDDSEQFDPSVWQYSCEVSSAILKYVGNITKISNCSTSIIRTSATELASGVNLSELASELCSRCHEAERAIEIFRTHNGAVRLSLDQITFLPNESNQSLAAAVSLEFKPATKQEFRIFLAEWSKFNRRPRASSLFVDGSPFTKISLSKTSYFVRSLDAALYEKFSILPDARLAPADLLARQMEERHGLKIVTKMIAHYSGEDFNPPFTLSDLKTVDLFLDRASVLRPFHGSVVKVEPDQKFDGSLAELREIMMLRFYKFTFQSLGSGRIEPAWENSKTFGVAVDPTRFISAPKIDFRKGPRPLAFSAVTLAALQSVENDYFSLVFLEVTQSSTLQLQLNRETFYSAWGGEVTETVRKVNSQLKIPVHKSLSAIVRILIGRVMLDVQRAVNDQIALKLSADQRDWIMANLDIEIGPNGLPTKALPPQK